MRAAADELLAQDAGLPRYDELSNTSVVLCGHLVVLIPEVENLARALPDGHVTRTCALTATGHARARLDAGPGPGLVSAVRHAKGLARALRALCDQFEALSPAGTGQPAATNPLYVQEKQTS